MKNKNYRFLVVFVLFSMVVIQAPQVFAGSATLNWNANAESDLAGYKIYYGVSATSPRIGTQPGTSGCGNCGYANVVNVGNVTSYALSNLTDGARYYFSVSAYDTSGNESLFSSEVYKDIPAIANIANITFSAKIEGPSVAASKSFAIRILTAGTSNVVGQASATTNTSGNLVFSSISVAAGTYDIIASSTSYLAEKITGVNLASNATITLPRLFGGDLDNSNSIGASDWSLMSPYWLTNNALADINDDNLVNSLDFGLMNKNWGRVGK
ncbi:MAG: fibronectin type III domain-containing protein [Patescibacteria group bacterium]